MALVAGVARHFRVFLCGRAFRADDGGLPPFRQEISTEEKNTTPLRQRMIEDKNTRGLCETTQKAHIRNVKHLASFLGRPPDTASDRSGRSGQKLDRGETPSRPSIVGISGALPGQLFPASGGHLRAGLS
ncbi:hypothetical protein B6V73_18295 [Thioclava sp. JM3]|nr:hypothetical protein B6V73_18295 [Thioclava sp. JM3]PWE48331.1 hypothetical protein DEM26_18465 [Thioclava sp. NG1]